MYYRFLDKAKNILTAAQKIRQEVENVGDLKLCSKDEVTLILYSHFLHRLQWSVLPLR